jgi:hypothetical protein
VLRDNREDSGPNTEPLIENPNMFAAEKDSGHVAGRTAGFRRTFEPIDNPHPPARSVSMVGPERESRTPTAFSQPTGSGPAAFSFTPSRDDWCRREDLNPYRVA